MRDELLKISIKDYIERMGINIRKEGTRYFCSSPFSSDSNWSFCIYPSNTYFDFSTGQGGNILNFVSRLHSISLSDAAKVLKEDPNYGTYEPFKKEIKSEEQQGSQAPFDYKKYINTDPEECAQIKAYAASRGITEGYFCGVFYTRSNQQVQYENERFYTNKQHRVYSGWIRTPALSFLHVDKQLQPCGVKFRKLTQENPRFSARGSLSWYLLDRSLDLTKLDVKSTVLYVVESETSANSLSSWLEDSGVFGLVISRGGVSSVPISSDLPEKLQPLRKKLIIDYDGNEKLYQQRLKLYDGLGAEPIKLELPKGEDINSLYVQGKMDTIKHLLL